MPAIRNIVIDQGTTFTKEFTPLKPNGEAYTLADYTIVAHIRRSYASSIGLAFTTAIVGSAGALSISLTAAETLSLRYGRYVYDIKLTKVGEEIRVFEGIATITPTVTR